MTDEFRTTTEPHPPQSAAQWSATIAILTAPIGMAFLVGLLIENASKRGQGRGR